MRIQVEVPMKNSGILRQVALIFAVGALLIGAFTYFSQQVVAENSVKRQTEQMAARVSDEVDRAIKEYPAHDWLLEYWYQNADRLDIEYDVDYTGDTKTRRKAERLSERYPDLQLKYAAEEDLEEMVPRDQKLYAEVTYSWLITRLNQIKRAQKNSFLFLAMTDSKHREQIFLLSASDPGGIRGTEYEQVYTLGVRSLVNESQKAGMDYAKSHRSYLADAGKYMDYYYYYGHIAGCDAFIGLTQDLSEIMDNVNHMAIRGTVFAIITQLLLAWICMVMIFRFTLQPLRKVQESIRGYVQSKNSDEFREELSDVDSRNEIGQLAMDMRVLSHEIDDHLEEIRTITAEKERINTELSLASTIQNSMLPATFPPFPDRREFEIYAAMDPAREVGGDFYDFFLIDDDHLCLVIADVAGKGIPAALFMMVSRTILADHAGLEMSPARIMRRANETICAKNATEMFVTVWLGILEISTGILTAVNAGHEYPAIKEKDGWFKIMRDKHGIVLGVMESAPYEEYQIRLEPGAKLFVYTDGVPEAQRQDGRQFQIENLTIALNKAREESPEGIIGSIRTSVDDFIQGAEQFDDMTMLCLEYRGPDTKES